MNAIRALTAAGACLVLGACASTSAPKKYSAFAVRPSKPEDCDFELFEEREPPRPYTVLGTLPFSANVWLGEKGRKEALQPTACKAGADAVLLPHPTVRRMNLGSGHAEELREYEARFVAWADVPAPPEPQAETPTPPKPSPGTVVVPAPSWEDSEGTAVHHPPEPSAR